MQLHQLIQEAYREDLPNGDVTTDSLGIEERQGHAKLIAKEDLVLACPDVFDACVRHWDKDAQLHWPFKEGDFILAGQAACSIHGDLIRLLKAERVALNFLGRLSGIATLTRCFAQLLTDTRCRILDTRKTTPLYRDLERRAVRAGGGHNHRLDLSAAVLIKENHIRAIGGLSPAVQAVREAGQPWIEVECATLDEVALAVKEKVDRILLDNMSNEQMAEARRQVPATIELEASGNMSLERLKGVAATGVDFISVGAITHSAPCADFSLLLDWAEKN